MLLFLICQTKETEHLQEYNIGYGLYLYFLGLSLRERGQGIVTSSYSQKKSCIISKKWKWIQKFRHRRISSTRRKKISEYIVDETILQVGPQYIWLWAYQT